jgi:hypothetical protein
MGTSIVSGRAIGIWHCRLKWCMDTSQMLVSKIMTITTESTTGGNPTRNGKSESTESKMNDKLD